MQLVGVHGERNAHASSAIPGWQEFAWHESRMDALYMLAFLNLLYFTDGTIITTKSHWALIIVVVVNTVALLFSISM